MKIRALLIGWAILGVLPCRAVGEEIQLSLLHTNDLAGRFEQILKAGAIKAQVQQEVGRVLLLDAGNAMSGFEAAFAHPKGRRSPTVTLLGRAGYDAFVPGYREFGLSLDVLTRFLSQARFPVLAANLHRPGTGRFLFQVQPFALVRAGRVRVGILGLSWATTGVWAGDPVRAARYYVPMLRKESDVVVALTHQTYEADSTLAVSVAGIDVIVGTFSAQVGSREVNGVQIRQSGADGDFMGRIDLTLTDGRVTAATGRLVPLDAPRVEDPDSLLSEWTLQVQGKGVPVGAVLGHSAGGFGGQEGQEAAMGYLIADLARAASKTDAALIAGRSVRGELPQGPIQALDLYSVYAPSHRVVVVPLKGDALKALFEQGLDRVDAFFYPAGLEILYNLDGPGGERVAGINLSGGDPIDKRKTYRVAVEDGIERFKGLGADNPGDLVRDILARHIRESGEIQGRVDGRFRSAPEGVEK